MHRIVLIVFILSESACGGVFDPDLSGFSDCSAAPCQNAGQCFDEERGHRCECAAGFTGDQCEIVLNEGSADGGLEEDCEVAACGPHGACAPDLTCSCDLGYEGDFCSDCTFSVENAGIEILAAPQWGFAGRFIGISFTPATEMTITHLGVPDIAAIDSDSRVLVEGLQGPVEVGLYNESGLLVQTAIEPEDVLLGHYRFRPVPQFRLDPGHEYQIMVSYGADQLFGTRLGPIAAPGNRLSSYEVIESLDDVSGGLPRTFVRDFSYPSDLDVVNFITCD